MAKSLLDEAFALLEESKLLEGKASMDERLLDQPPSAIVDAASRKKYEACYLMKRHYALQASNNSDADAKTLQLLQDKINEYEDQADQLRKKAEKLKLMEQGQSTVTDTRYSKNSSSITSSITSFEETHLHSVEDLTRNKLPMKAPFTNPNVRDRTEDNVATRAAGEATKLLTVAINEDENGNIDKAILKYVKAVELYLKAVRILSETDKNRSLQQRGGIDTSESPSNSDDPQQLVASLKKRIKVTLDRVEKLKLRGKESKNNSDQTESQMNETNHQQSGFTSDELDVLVRSSLLTSGVFLPWSDAKARIFNFSPSQKFVDPDGALELSEKQKAKFHRWARPEEVMAMRSSSSRNIKMISAISPYTIKQHCVSDCSFIAALCISAAYERRLGRQLVSSLIYPQDSNGTPIYNPQGVYMVKLWLNGVARRVIVDDYLPVDKEGKLLCSHTIKLGENKSNRSNNLELWVPILEKAYMKMCGGYDFPGSNSGVDLFSLTGWIPERIFFPKDNNRIKDFETPIERCWEKLYSASSFNDCLITMATSKELTDEQASSVGLYTSHAYAVLRIIQTSNGTRLLQLKNPWGRSGWNGQYSAQDKISWSDTNFSREVGYDANAAAKCDDGVFWMSWSDSTIYFTNIHISWNPELFRFQKVSHAFWKADIGPNDDSFNVGENPQYTVTLSQDAIQKNATLWILVSRHVTKQEQEGCEAEDYIAAHIHRIQNSMQRVYYPGGKDCISTGAYTNNQHNLIRFDANGPGDRLLSIVLSQYKKTNDLGFTLSCFCTEDFDLGQPAEEMAIYRTLYGKWELRGGSNKYSLEIGSAGGSPGKGSFGSNPQWNITVLQEGTKLQLKCSAGKKLAINVVLVRTTRKRIHHLYEQPFIDTGSYRFGFTVSDVVSVPPGMYNLVASTFEVGEVGSFVLQVLSSSEHVEISEIT